MGLGLVCLFVDFPRLAALYNTDLPSDIFEAHYKQNLEGMPTEARNAFFVVADAAVPSAIRARSLYYGSMFRIGFEAIVFIGSFQVVPWIVAVHAKGVTPPAATAGYWWLLAVVAVPLAWPVAVLTARDYRKTKSIGQAALAAPRIIVADLGPLDGIVLCAAVVCISIGFAIRHGSPATQALFLISISLTSLHWLGRFIFGRRNPDSPASGIKGRKALDRSTILVLFIVATYSAAVPGIYRGHRIFVSDQSRVAIWLVAAAFTSLLIASRGIEKRLRGGYSTLTSWLKLNPTEIGKVLGWPNDAEP